MDGPNRKWVYGALVEVKKLAMDRQGQRGGVGGQGGG